MIQLYDSIPLPKIEKGMRAVHAPHEFETSIQNLAEDEDDLAVFVKIGLFRTNKSKIEIYATQDETLFYAAGMQSALETVVQDIQKRRIPLKGFRIELSGGKVYGEGFTPERTRFYFLRWFRDIFAASFTWK